MRRNYSPLDKLVFSVDRAMRVWSGFPEVTERENPAAHTVEVELTEAQRKHSAGLLRVDHAGEVCAQGLYQGQALTARSEDVKQKMHHSAQEENDHLDWCHTRLQELGSHPSYLNPVWYMGSLMIGVLAGLAGDKWSLGFVAETETQVVKHLGKHLDQLPENDNKSHAVLQQMCIDEAGHANVAVEAGANELPAPIKKAMSLTSKVMTTLSYWV